MTSTDPGALAGAQRRHWQSVYAEHPGMYGSEPSQPALHAATVFAGTVSGGTVSGGTVSGGTVSAGSGDVLELGAGHGRDSLFFARCGLRVTALDFSTTGLRQLEAAAIAAGVAERVRTVAADVREPLPLADGTYDAVFAHMLLCMALPTVEIRALVAEVARVLRPGGVFVYTVRHTGDAHYGTGVAHGDDIYEDGGFAVHFDRELVDELARGWELREVHPFEEGDLPRRLWRITQARPAAG